MRHLTSNELEALLELVFLGNWVVNSHRLYGEKIVRYEALADEFQKLHKKILPKAVLCDDMFEYYFRKLGKFIEKYDDEVCFPTLAEKLAKADFPVNPNATIYNGTIHMQIDAQNIYEIALKEKGVSIVSIDIPDILDRLEICHQRFKRGKS